MTQFVGNGNHAGAWNGDKLAISAIDGITQHAELAAQILLAIHAFRAMSAEGHRGEQYALSGLQVSDVFADLRDFARHVAAIDMRQLDAGQAFADPQVEMIQRTDAHPNQNLIFPQLRLGHVLVLEHFRTAKLVKSHSFHPSSPTNTWMYHPRT